MHSGARSCPERMCMLLEAGKSLGTTLTLGLWYFHIWDRAPNVIHWPVFLLSSSVFPPSTATPGPGYIIDYRSRSIYWSLHFSCFLLFLLPFLPPSFLPFHPSTPMYILLNLLSFLPHRYVDISKSKICGVILHPTHVRFFRFVIPHWGSEWRTVF